MFHYCDAHYWEVALLGCPLLGSFTLGMPTIGKFHYWDVSLLGCPLLGCFTIGMPTIGRFHYWDVSLLWCPLLGGFTIGMPTIGRFHYWEVSLYNLKIDTVLFLSPARPKTCGTNATYFRGKKKLPSSIQSSTSFVKAKTTWKYWLLFVVCKKELFLFFSQPFSLIKCFYVSKLVFISNLVIACRVIPANLIKF